MCVWRCLLRFGRCDGVQRARGRRRRNGGDAWAPGNRDRWRRWCRDWRNRGRACDEPRFLGLADGRHPRPGILLRIRLEVIRPRRGHDAKGVLAPLQRDGRARVHVLQLEQPVQLVFGRRLVVGQMRGAQHKPPSLPSLRCACNRRKRSKKEKNDTPMCVLVCRHGNLALTSMSLFKVTHLTPFTFLPEVPRAEVAGASSAWLIGRAPRTGILFVILRVFARRLSLRDGRQWRWSGGARRGMFWWQA